MSALDPSEVFNIADGRVQVVMRSTTMNKCFRRVKRPPFVDLTRGRDRLLETLVFLLFFYGCLRLPPSHDGAELWDTLTSVVPAAGLGAETGQVAAMLAVPEESSLLGAPAPKLTRRRAL